MTALRPERTPTAGPAGRRDPSRRRFLGIALGVPVVALAGCTASEGRQESLSRSEIEDIVEAVNGKPIAVTHDSARAWFDLHRSDYAEVLTRIETGEFGRPDDWDYYGPQLPENHRGLSVTGKVSRLADMSPDAGVRVSGYFFPTWTGIPDDAVGIAWLDRPPSPAAQFDGYGLQVRAHLDLGNGWWYLDPGRD
ncbi:hypothetical protein [Yinghuangia soli]|uniref:Uncharacterized protein n=1 Tax=Yinghuangia soli TaxID=2908204 RepID=A0AA41U547_9ACTN|nr:hypothetical protein [Yinghuangia soli]MCF2533610.1 hypothetical protein [Yinghuangia soli]